MPFPLFEEWSQPFAWMCDEYFVGFDIMQARGKGNAVRKGNERSVQRQTL
jgi:hypothetical protein